MNKLAIVLLFAGFTGNATSMSGDFPGEKTLVTGAKIDETLLALYSPIMKKMCEENAEAKDECQALVRLAYNFRMSIDPTDKSYHTLLEAKLIYSDGNLRPEIQPLARASFIFNPWLVHLFEDHQPIDLHYRNPVNTK
jgi:hypothetical protein